MKSTGISILLLIFAGFTHAQHLGPMDWESEQDYRDAEQSVLINILWLEENPFATDENDTKTISNYILKWISETPYISVTLDQVFTAGIVNSKKYKYSDKFQVTYLFGKSLYVIENPDDPNEVEASVRGLAGMVKVYREILKIDSDAKNRNLELYKNLYESERLKEYVASQLKNVGS